MPFLKIFIFASIFNFFWSSYDYELEICIFLFNLFYTTLLFIFGEILFYLSMEFEYFWYNQQQLIYSYFNYNEIILWILDSFMAPEKIFLEFWNIGEYFEPKVFVCRIFIYFLAIICYKLMLFLMALFFAALYLTAFYHFLDFHSHPYRNSFPFETLPYSIQRRFFDLQTPTTRYKFSKAYANLFSCYKKLYVDNLYLAPKLLIPSGFFLISVTVFNNTSSNDQKYDVAIVPKIKLNINQNDWKRIYKNGNLGVLKNLQIDNFAFDEIVQVFSSIDISNLLNLIIVNSTLSSSDLMQLKTLKLKFILLGLKNDRTKYMKKAREILEATINIPEIEFYYKKGILKKDDNFEVFLVEWVLTNGYFKSFMCHAFYEQNGNNIYFSS